MLDLAGCRFGSLLVLRATAERRERCVMWRCLCDCGARVLVRASTLRAGRTISCGCSRKPTAPLRNRRHGHTSGGNISPEYRAWTEMKRRCLDRHRKEFKNYGGRGIAIHAAWASDFAAFFACVGPRPSSRHSIDRYPNNDGNYEPGNVRWATAKQQANNRRKRERKHAAK